MGCPEYCYKTILKDFILCNNRLTKQYNELKENILPNKSIEELEAMALKYRHKNKDYSIFVMGACCNAFLNEWNENIDMINAAAGAISDIQDLFNIDEEKDGYTDLIWHDCKTDPPKENGMYLLCDVCDDVKYLSHAFYDAKDNIWQGYCNYIIDIPYKWAEVDLSEVE